MKYSWRAFMKKLNKWQIKFFFITCFRKSRYKIHPLRIHCWIYLRTKQANILCFLIHLPPGTGLALSTVKMATKYVYFLSRTKFLTFWISCFFYKFLWTFSVPRIFEKLKLPLREEALQVPIQIGRPIQLLCRKWNVEPRGKTLESPRRRLHGPGNPRVDGPQRWEAHWLSVSFQKFRKL